MDTSPIPAGYAEELDLRHLQVFEVVLRERSLTRAAEVLNVSQPALSKTLARLRDYFSDPLFVRVSLRMEPTPKALELAQPVREILERMRRLKSAHVPFDPRTSSRIFSFCVVDAGVIRLMPPLVNLLMEEAPRVRVRALQLDVLNLAQWLESGTIDFAMGSFPSLAKQIRRQALWVEKYVSVVREGHPRLSARPGLKEFTGEKHVVVSTLGTGHAHKLAEQALEKTIPQENIICRVPMFTAAAVVAKRADAVATLPMSVARVLAPELGLRMITPPIRLPRIEIYQYWHERFHREEGNRWIRSVFARLYKEQTVREPQ